MRIATTIGQDQDGKWSALALPDTDIGKQKAAFKELKSDKDTASKYQQIMILTSSGQVRRAKYPNLKVQEAIRKATAKQIADAEKEADKAAKAEKAKASKKTK